MSSSATPWPLPTDLAAIRSYRRVTAVDDDRLAQRRGRQSPAWETGVIGDLFWVSGLDRREPPNCGVDYRGGWLRSDSRRPRAMFEAVDDPPRSRGDHGGPASEQE